MWEPLNLHCWMWEFARVLRVAMMSGQMPSMSHERVTGMWTFRTDTAILRQRQGSKFMNNSINGLNEYRKTDKLLKVMNIIIGDVSKPLTFSELCLDEQLPKVQQWLRDVVLSEEVTKSFSGEINRRVKSRRNCFMHWLLNSFSSVFQSSMNETMKHAGEEWGHTVSNFWHVEVGKDLSWDVQ